MYCLGLLLSKKVQERRNLCVDIEEDGRRESVSSGGCWCLTGRVRGLHMAVLGTVDWQPDAAGTVRVHVEQFGTVGRQLGSWWD